MCCTVGNRVYADECRRECAGWGDVVFVVMMRSGRDECCVAGRGVDFPLSTPHNTTQLHSQLHCVDAQREADTAKAASDHHTLLSHSHMLSLSRHPGRLGGRRVHRWYAAPIVSDQPALCPTPACPPHAREHERRGAARGGRAAATAGVHLLPIPRRLSLTPIPHPAELPHAHSHLLLYLLLRLLLSPPRQPFHLPPLLLPLHPPPTPRHRPRRAPLRHQARTQAEPHDSASGSSAASPHAPAPRPRPADADPRTQRGRAGPSAAVPRTAGGLPPREPHHTHRRTRIRTQPHVHDTPTPHPPTRHRTPPQPSPYHHPLTSHFSPRLLCPLLLPSCSHLYLSHNRISRIENLLHLHKLEQLYTHNTPHPPSLPNSHPPLTPPTSSLTPSPSSSLPSPVPRPSLCQSPVPQLHLPSRRVQPRRRFPPGPFRVLFPPLYPPPHLSPPLPPAPFLLPLLPLLLPLPFPLPSPPLLLLSRLPPRPPSPDLPRPVPHLPPLLLLPLPLPPPLSHHPPRLLQPPPLPHPPHLHPPPPPPPRPPRPPPVPVHGAARVQAGGGGGGGGVDRG